MLANLRGIGMLRNHQRNLSGYKTKEIWSCYLSLISCDNALLFGKRTIVSADNRQCGQLSVRTIVSADNCQEDICQGAHLSKKSYFKIYHDGYRWKGLDFKIVNLQFILVVCEFKT
jgi:hypothetical protein